MTHLYTSDLEEFNRNSDGHPSVRPLLHSRLPSQASSTAHLPRAQERRVAPVTRTPAPPSRGAHTASRRGRHRSLSPHPTESGNTEEKLAISKR